MRVYLAQSAILLHSSHALDCAVQAINLTPRQGLEVEVPRKQAAGEGAAAAFLLRSGETSLVRNWQSGR